MGPRPDDPGLNAREIPLSLSQQEVWLDQLAWPGSNHLVIGGGGFLQGPLDAGLCSRALSLLVQRHDALRLAPLRTGGQRVLASFQPDLQWVEVDPSQAPQAAMQAWWAEHARRPFAFDGTPPWRFAVLRCHAQLHGLVMQFHHTVMDGWGASQVMRQWSDLYNILHGGHEPPAAPAEGYEAAVQESLDYAKSAAWERDGRFWAEQVRLDEEPVLARRPGRGHGDTLPAALTEILALERDGYEALRGDAAREGRTPFTCFLAATAWFLARVSGRRRVSIGVPTLNRGGRRFLGTPGMFVGVLVIQLEVDLQASAGALCASAAQAMRGALRHARYPLSALARRLGASRNPRDALFDVMLSFEQQDYGVRFGAAERVDSRQLFSGVARYALGLTVCEFHDRQDPQLILEGSADHFDAGDMPWMARRLWHMVRTLAAQPQARLSDLPWLPPDERAWLLDGAHAHVAWRATPPTPLAAFEAWARASPSATALVWDGGEMDYATLDARAHRLAHRLRARGAGRDAVVAMALPRSPDLAVALLAVAKAGAASLPLDPDAPLARLAEVLAQSRAVALLIAEYAWERLGHLHEQTLVPGWDHALPAPAASEAPAQPCAGDLAYVLFTSGSTGRPKGVMVEHGALARRMAWIAQAYGVRAEDRAALATQITFDPAMIEFWLPLMHGASVALAPAGRLGSAAVAEFARRHAVTIMAFVPSTLPGFLDAVAGAADLRLRVACCGGDVLPPELAARFVRQTGARLFNVYGPTEACIFATAWPCTASPGEGPLPIGAPIDDTVVRVLDGERRPMPVGVAGELWIGGEALARGYLHRPELDAQAFCPDPWRDGGRLYRTGDRGWVDAQGQLHFIGRTDRQVKIRGYRVELGEIEAALLAIEGIRQAAVCVRAWAGRPTLLAWVAPSGAFGAPALQRLLRLRLPDYMVPSAITALPELPTGSTGKVDAQALPDPPLRRDADAPDRPLRPIERDLLRLWQDVLGRTGLGVHDDFFEVGGDSLAAVSILTGAERLLGRRIPLYLLTEHPTIASLVDALDARPEPASVLVPLSESRGMPVYLAASGHGDRLRLQALAAALTPACSLVMLQPPESGMPARIGDLAALYAERIEARAGGACVLAGFSIGGIAALEAARSLRRRGVDVRAVVLIETVYPKRVWGGSFYWRAFRWLVSHLRIQDLSVNGRRLGAMVADAGLNGQVMAMAGYRPVAFDGPMALIKTQGLSRWHGMLFRSWRTLAGARLSEYLVPGMHGSVFEPAHVAALADTLVRIARAAQALPTEPAACERVGDLAADPVHGGAR